MVASAETGWAFVSNGRWNVTATDGLTDPLGNPVTLTWSIVPDGTTISHLGKPSNLVSTFDGLFPGDAALPLGDKSWFALFQQCFDRWSQVSGVTLTYEPMDDGLSSHSHGLWTGALGVRGDVRLGGALIDGIGGTLASAGFIPNADITIDTSDTTYHGAPGIGNNYIQLRTTLMHEIGHSLGLDHVDSNNSALLMERDPQTSVDGPQFDDVRGVHYLYGDRYEKSLLGNNNTLPTATELGTVAAGSSYTVGSDGTTGVRIEPDEVDFVSISNSNDADFYSFAVEQPSLVDLVLTPVGPTYNERTPPLAPTPTISASKNDLTLELYSNGEGGPTLMSAVDLTAAGQMESILSFELPAAATYYARVGGKDDQVQLYTLSISVAESLPLLLGDFNDDHVVDAADYSVWRDNLGAPDDSAIFGRGDGVMGVDMGDYMIWKAHFGETDLPGGFGARGVPEPATAVGLATLLTLTAGTVRFRAKYHSPGAHSNSSRRRRKTFLVANEK